MKNKVLLLLLIGLSVFYGSLHSQFITIGSGTTQTTSTGSDPINGFYNSMRYQVVYTAAELSAAGLLPGSTLTGIGWSVSADYAGGALGNYTISLAHTSAVNSASHDNSPLTQVINPFSYDPTVVPAGSHDMINFNTNFVWDGVNNILVDVCSGTSNPFISPYGRVRTLAATTTNGSRAIECDVCGSQCGVATTTVNSTKPQVRFNFNPPPPCTGVPVGGTITPSTINACSGQTVTLTAVGATAAPGISYQWQVSPTPGGPYFNVVGGTGATTTSYTTAPLSTGTYYGILKVKCSTGPDSAYSNEVVVNVTTSPTVGVSPTSATYCPGTSGIVLTGSGASTYTWGPAAGLSATVGSPVTATPSSTTTYTVTGTDGVGCTGTATTVITVNENPSLISVTATPSSVCSGGNSQLLATAALTTSYGVTSIPFASVATPGAGVTTLANGGAAVTALTAGSLDDGDWINQTLPFGFNFFGNYYTSFAISTNGFIWLGAGAPPTYTGYNNAWPSGASARPAIGATYSDLDFRTTGTIEYFTVGSTPNRQFIINWKAGQFYNGVGSINTQLIIYETTNVIEVHTTNSSGNNNAVEGIQNATGTAVVAPGRNNTLWPVATPDAYRWTPTGTPLTYSWSPATFLSSTSVNNPMANGVTASTTYTVTITNGGCSVTGTASITAGSPLTSSAITSNSPVCQGSNLTSTANPSGGGAPYTYKWDYGMGQFTTPTASLSINTIPPGSYTLYSIVLDQCGDSTIQSTPITINPTPTALASSNSPICEGQTLNLTGATDIGTSFIWTGPSSYSSSTQNPSIPSALVTNSGTYSFSSVAGPCTSSVSTVVVTVNQNPAGVTASATPSAVCSGSSTDLQSSAVPNLLTNIFTENFNGGAPTWTRINNSTGGTPANAAWTNRPDGFVYAGGTAYHSNDNTQFVQTNSDSQGSGSTTNTILVSPSFSTIGMAGISVNFYHYYRDINDNGDSAVVEASLDGTTWVLASAFTATTGSENSFTHPTVNLPASFDNQSTVYIRFRYKGTWDWYWSIDNVSVNGLSASYTYSWDSNPVGFTSTAQNPTGVIPPSTSDYTVTVTNSVGCTATASTTVTVDDVVAYISPINIMCNGANDGSFTLDSVRCGTLPFTYSIDGGSYAPIPNNLTPGNHTVTIQDDLGLFSSPMSITITQPSWMPDVPTVTPSNVNLCVGDSSALFTIPGSGSVVIYFDVATSPIESASPGTLFATATMPALPSGAVVTSAQLTYANVNSVGGSWNSEVRLGTSGAINELGVAGTGAAGTGGIFTYTRPVTPGSINTSGGTVNLLYWESFDDLVVGDAVFPTGTAVASIVINYSVNGMVSPDSVNWYDAAVGGTLLATNDSLEAVGTSVLPNTNTPGTYTFYAEGFYHGCTSATRTAVTVVVGAYPVVNLGPDAAYCNNHVLDAGNPGLTYSWNDGSTNQTLNALDTATYWVDVTSAVGCTTRDSINLVINPLPTVDLGPDTVSCGSYLLDPGPQPGTSTFLWNDMSTGSTLFTTTSGDYDVTVTDINGCVNADTVHVDVPPITSTNIGPDTTLCTNDTGFLLDATQPGANTYVWQDGSTGSSFFVNLPGTYWVTLTNFVGCSYTDTIVVASVNPVQTNIDVNFITTSSATLDAGSGFTSYVWSTSATSQVITVTANGQYVVTVTDNNGCITTDTVNIVFSLGIFNPDGSTSIMKLYPNPSDGVFNLSIDNLETANLVAEVLDLNGKVVYNRVIGAVDGSVIEPFSLTDLRMGTYVLRLTANGKTSQLRFIIGR